MSVSYLSTDDGRWAGQRYHKPPPMRRFIPFSWWSATDPPTITPPPTTTPPPTPHLPSTYLILSAAPPPCILALLSGICSAQYSTCPGDVFAVLGRDGRRTPSVSEQPNAPAVAIHWISTKRRMFFMLYHPAERKSGLSTAPSHLPYALSARTDLVEDIIKRMFKYKVLHIRGTPALGKSILLTPIKQYLAEEYHRLRVIHHQYWPAGTPVFPTDPAGPQSGQMRPLDFRNCLGQADALKAGSKTVGDWVNCGLLVPAHDPISEPISVSNSQLTAWQWKRRALPAVETGDALTRFRESKMRMMSYHIG
ncbi:hypothetical protein BDD12DRAFT_980367 [Trichophaea hybrida]|nr:hypothetical protein BDD12DRAFT_980367 [Trichophaea hybrida]